MGILNFHKWIKTNHKNCYQRINNCIDIEHLYIDINFCLHCVAHNTTEKNVLFDKLYLFIDDILDNIKPTKSITFATDGPAPYAKLLLQRARRQAISKSLSTNFDSNDINPLYFTPGTKFMLEFESNFNNYIENIKKKYKINIHKLFDGPNEAEFKIINNLISINKCYPDDKHIIFSNDADVIVMATSTYCYDKIFVTTNLKNIYETYNIQKIGEILNSIKDTHNSSRHLDMSFISLFLGNDYLPKLYYINMDTLINMYYITLKKQKNNLLYNGDININFLKDFMFQLVEGSKNKFTNSFNISKYDSNIYKNYLEGIVWCMNCYQSGLCNKYDYMYKYDENPHPFGIYYYLIFGNRIEQPIPYPFPIDSHIYSLLLLPKKAKKLIDKKYHPLMDNELKFLYEEESCKVCAELDSKISDLRVTKKYINSIGENNEKILKKINILSKKICEHKSIHKKIKLQDINYIINILKKNP